MNLATQAKVLRVICEQQFEPLGSNATIKVDVRIIAATNKNLHEQIANNKFREDLFYRLNVIPIHLPPLRERKEDIPLLVQHFLLKLQGGEGFQKKELDGDAMDLLKEYSWPGNVRELENVIERLVILSTGNSITADDVRTGFSMEQTTQKDISL
ncbi:MAG: Nif-specific regulatory protein [Actinobacteria bacterium]|nr:Nif-specific regulatory protein [Actinomycetota bacterium]